MGLRVGLEMVGWALAGDGGGPRDGDANEAENETGH